MELELCSGHIPSSMNYIQNEPNTDISFDQYDSLGNNNEPCRPSGDWRGPKTLTVARGVGGFGFTLRYFVVYPPSSIYNGETKPAEESVDSVFSNPSPQIVTSNATTKPLDTFFVKDIITSSPADLAGLAEGDRIVSVNGCTLSGKSYSDVVKLIQDCSEELILVVVPKDDDILQLVYKEHAYNRSAAPVKDPQSSSSSGSTLTPESSMMQQATINKWSTPIYNSSRRSSSGASSDSENVLAKVKKYDPCVTFKSGTAVVSPEMKFSVMVRNSRSGSVSSSGGSTPGRRFDFSSISTSKPVIVSPCTAFVGGRAVIVPQNSTDESDSTETSKTVTGISPSQLNNALEKTINHITTNTSERHTVGEASYAMSTSAGGRRGSGSSRRRSNDNVTNPGIVQRLAGLFGAQKNVTDSTTSPTSVLRDDFKYPVSGQSSASTSRKNSHDKHDIVENQEILHNREKRKEKIDQNENISIEGLMTAAPSKSNEVCNASGGAVSPRLRNRTASQAAVLRRNRGCNLTSLTSHATLVESDERILKQLLSGGINLSGANLSNNESPIAVEEEQLVLTSASANNSPSIESTCVSSTTAATIANGRQREPTLKNTGYLMSLDRSSPCVLRKMSSSDESEITPTVINDEGGIHTSTTTMPEMDDDSADAGSWRSRRISYLMATEANKGSPVGITAPIAIPEDDGVGGEDDDDSDNRSCGRQLSVESISCTDDDDDHHSFPVIKEGFLNCKLVHAGRNKKRMVSRTWKPIFVQLRGNTLFCYKEKPNGITNTPRDSNHQHAVDMEGATINIAHDYGKRKHVFRVTTTTSHEFLLQAVDTAVMMSWINVLRDCEARSEDGIVTGDPAAKKTKVNESDNTAASSPPTPKHSIGKKSLSIRKSHFSLGRVTKQKRGFVNVQISIPKDKETSALGYTFGNSLSSCPQAKDTQFVPLLVEHCCRVVEEKGLDYIGIYRVPGNAAAVQLLREELDIKEPEAIDWTEEKWYDLNNISSLLKSFLRKLREPIIPHDFYDTLIQVSRKEDSAARLTAIKAHIRSLPTYHFETLKYLIHHLRLVADHGESNKMEPKNLAIVFGPTVIRASDENMVSMVKDMSDQCRIIETLVHQFDWMFDFEDTTGPESPLIKPQETMESNCDGIVSSKGLMESLGQMAVSMSAVPQTTSSHVISKGNSKENKQSVASALMSITNFTSNFSSKLRSKAMSPLLQKKFVKSDSWGSGDSSPVIDRVTSPLQHSPTGSDSGPENRQWRTGRCDTDDDVDFVETTVQKGKGNKKPKSRALASLPSWPGVGSGSKSRSKSEEKKRSRSGSLEKDKPRFIVHMPTSPIIHQPGKEEVLKIDMTVDPRKTSTLSERTRLRLKQVNDEHQAASERRQMERQLIDLEHRKLLEDIERDDEDELLSPLATSPLNHFMDSDGTASNTSDSGSTSRKASLDSLSSPVVGRRIPFHHRQISNSSISSEERSPRPTMRRINNDSRWIENSETVFDCKTDLTTVAEESHCRITNRSFKPDDMRVDPNSLDAKLRRLIDPSYDEAILPTHHNVSTKGLSSNDHSTTSTESSPITAVTNSTKVISLPQSIRSIDSKFKTKVIGLHTTNLPTVSSSDMTVKIDNLKNKRADLEKKVTNILQENSAARQRENPEYHAPLSNVNRLKLAPVAVPRTLIFKPSSLSVNQTEDDRKEDSNQRLERNVKNVTELLRTSQNPCSDGIDLESSLTKLQLKCLQNGHPPLQLQTSSNSVIVGNSNETLSYTGTRCDDDTHRLDAAVRLTSSPLETH